MTQGEWKALGGVDRTHEWDAGGHVAYCAEPDCPIANLSFYSALEAANFYSIARGVAPCYELTNCRDGGLGYLCDSVTLTAPSVYECTGYRLPTEAEWEYATRAGTTTSTYAGPLVERADSSECGDDPVLNSIAWFCANSDASTHPVRKKVPNAWGLYDVAGNVPEVVWDPFNGLGYGDSPRVDPGGAFDPGPSGEAPVRGGYPTAIPVFQRSASRVSVLRDERFPGLRLVRTAL